MIIIEKLEILNMWKMWHPVEAVCDAVSTTPEASEACQRSFSSSAGAELGKLAVVGAVALGKHLLSKNDGDNSEQPEEGTSKGSSIKFAGGDDDYDEEEPDSTYSFSRSLPPRSSSSRSSYGRRYQSEQRPLRTSSHSRFADLSDSSDSSDISEGRARDIREEEKCCIPCSLL